MGDYSLIDREHLENMLRVTNRDNAYLDKKLQECEENTKEIKSKANACYQRAKRKGLIGGKRKTRRKRRKKGGSEPGPSQQEETSETISNPPTINPGLGDQTNPHIQPVIPPDYQELANELANAPTQQRNRSPSRGGKRKTRRKRRRKKKRKTRKRRKTKRRKRKKRSRKKKGGVYTENFYDSDRYEDQFLKLYKNRTPIVVGEGVFDSFSNRNDGKRIIKIDITPDGMRPTLKQFLLEDFDNIIIDHSQERGRIGS